MNALTKTTNCAFRAKKWRDTTPQKFSGASRRIGVPHFRSGPVPPHFHIRSVAIVYTYMRRPHLADDKVLEVVAEFPVAEFVCENRQNLLVAAPDLPLLFLLRLRIFSIHLSLSRGRTTLLVSCSFAPLSQKNTGSPYKKLHYRGPIKECSNTLGRIGAPTLYGPHVCAKTFHEVKVAY